MAEKKALTRLRKMQLEFAASIRESYERKAASCLTCTTPGACCLDAHFVNVHISRLEATAIVTTLAEMPEPMRERVSARIDETIAKYNLDDTTEIHDQKYACPLFEKGTGCLVHTTGKPVACTVHACYEDPADVPPDELQFEQERRIDRLNELTYRRSEPWLPLPLAIRRAKI